MKRKASTILLALALLSTPVFGAAGCADGEVAVVETTAEQTTPSVDGSVSSTGAGTATTSADGATATADEAMLVSYDSEDKDATWDAAKASHIMLAGDSIRFDGIGATVNGSTITITAPGTFVIAGTLDDGQIVVAAEGDGTVRLVLNGVDIANSTSSPIFVSKADKAIVTLADGTKNTVSDGATYTYEDSESEEPDAAIFSKDDLTINGSGALTVMANYRNGIASKDDLKITGGTIDVEAVNDALKGRDCIGVKSGDIALTAGGDALQSTNDGDTAKGYISIGGGKFVIDAGADAIQAQTTLAVTGGEFTISTGGGSANSSQNMGDPGNTWGRWDGDRAQTSAQSDVSTTAAADSTVSSSAKALKAGTGVFVTGGTFGIDSSDDSIHSNGNVSISGGSITLASGDDGVHADSDLEISGGEITITKSYEGLEASVVTINEGTIHLQSSDDGINVAGGADASSTSGRPGQNAFVENENNKLYINGGYVVIDANGDALDCNGRVEMTGGTVIANGPTNDGNGALDYMGEFKITGGYIVAVGSSGMAEAPSETSSQNSLMVNFDQVQQAGTLIHIESEDGEDILTIAPTKQFQSVVLSSSALKDGVAYKVYLGGDSTGTVTDALYAGGSYTPGTEHVSLTLEGMVTTSGATGGMQGPGGMGRDGGRPKNGAVPGQDTTGGM